MKRYKNISALLFLPVLLAGCSEMGSVVKDRQPAQWKPWEPKVETATRQKDFAFKGGQSSLTAKQLSDLKHMAISTDGSAKVSARIITHTTLDKVEKEPFRSRVNCIVRALIKAGVSKDSIDVISQASTTKEAGAILTVAIDQSKMARINCPGWNYDLGNTAWPEGEPDFGCATASNISQMVANPRDLDEGRAASTGDAIRNDLSEHMYRIDKIKPLMKNEKISVK